jgi:hypothetical protein
MVAWPSTGGTLANTLQPTFLPTAIRKGTITSIIIGDYKINGVPVNLNNCGTNANGVFTPFAADGTLRTDLLWNSTSPTLMGFSIGLTKEDGWKFDPKITVDKTPTGQSIWSARNDITEISGTLGWTARQWMPLIDLLRMDAPTLNAAGQSIVPDIGTSGYSVGANGYQQLCERWIIAIGFDGPNMFSITIPRCSQQTLGATEAQRKNPVDTMLAYEILLDPNTSQPYIVSNGGPGWLGEGGSPSFPSSPSPTATPVTGLKVTITFPAPTGLDVSTVTYTATKTTGGTTTALTIPSSGAGSPSVSGGIVSFTGSGLTASAVYTGAVVTATGDNGATATLAIPTFTATAS